MIRVTLAGGSIARQRPSAAWMNSLVVSRTFSG